MKKSFYLAAIVLMSTIIIACDDDEEATPTVDESGLTAEITDLVPQSVLDEMERLNMPINGGANPPILDATYLGSPFILVSSNRPGDQPGMIISNYKVTFSGQDNTDLTVMVDYENGPESGNGLGSFIVGEGNKFSVFVEIDAVHIGGTTAKFTHVISGNLVNDGIEDLYFANFMIDDNGDPQQVWIENGEGRVFHDQDGFSELIVE